MCRLLWQTYQLDHFNGLIVRLHYLDDTGIEFQADGGVRDFL